MQAPLVSIITPSFNQAAFIGATIDSVLAQRYPRIEYLVVDGGSTDGTLEVLRGYGDRLRWISEPDQGQADAIMKGFQRCRGEVLAWLNSDDCYLPDAIEQVVAAFEADPQVGLVYGHADYIDASGAYLEPAWVVPFDLLLLLRFGDFIVQPAAFFRRSAYDLVGGLDRQLHYCMDYDLWIRLARRFPVHYLPQKLAQARRYPAAKTFRGGLQRLEEIERVLRRYGRSWLPESFYPEMIVESARHGVQALRNWQVPHAARLCWRSGWYGLLYAIRRVRHGRIWPR